MKNLFYSLATLMVGLSSYAQCITNGDFELGVTANYTFKINPDVPMFEVINCDVNTLGYDTFTMSPLTNQFLNQGGTLVSATSSESYGPFDEKLFEVGSFVYRVSPSLGGTRAMKLNANSGSADITTMSVQVASAPQNIMFDYSIVTQNPHPDTPTRQPFFTVRLYNVSTGLRIPGEFCVKADAADPKFVETNTGDILYTNWQCGSLPVPAAYVGKNVRLEFVIADCGEGGHYGTVYIDNIRCGTQCNTFGKIDLDAITKSCPDQPFNVCGSFTTPSNSSIINNSISLFIIDINGNITALPTTATLSGNTFCFLVDPIVFGTNPSGKYEFRVSVDFQTPSGAFKFWGSSPSIGPDVMFGTLSPGEDTYITPNLASSGDILYWDDVDEIYTLEFRADSVCCGGLPLGVEDPNAYYTTTTTNNFIDLSMPVTNLNATRCFRWRIKTKCGWSGWCCLASNNYSIPNKTIFSNLLAPNCYIGDLCEDTIVIPNTVENTVNNQNQLVVDKEISITAHNVIKNGGKGIYRAGQLIELLPSFTSENGSIFSATIEICIGEDTPSQLTSRTMDSEFKANVSNTVNAVSAKRLVLYPNPSNDYINLSVANLTLKNVTVISLDGNTMFNGSIDAKAKLDISKYKKGFYFVTVTTENGDIYTEKLMVN